LPACAEWGSLGITINKKVLCSLAHDDFLLNFLTSDLISVRDGEQGEFLLPILPINKGRVNWSGFHSGRFLYKRVDKSFWGQIIVFSWFFETSVNFWIKFWQVKI
jgi:hypothetical protein